MKEKRGKNGQDRQNQVVEGIGSVGEGETPKTPEMKTPQVFRGITDISL